MKTTTNHLEETIILISFNIQNDKFKFIYYNHIKILTNQSIKVDCTVDMI
jgi:hypothetical protein